MGPVKAEERKVEEGAQWNKNLQGVTAPPLYWCCRAVAAGKGRGRVGDPAGSLWVCKI